MKKIFMTISALLMLTLNMSAYANTGEQTEEVDCSKINGQMYELEADGSIRLDPDGNPVLKGATGK